MFVPLSKEQTNFLIWVLKHEEIREMISEEIVLIDKYDNEIEETIDILIGQLEIAHDETGQAAYLRDGVKTDS